MTAPKDSKIQEADFAACSNEGISRQFIMYSQNIEKYLKKPKTNQKITGTLDLYKFGITYDEWKEQEHPRDDEGKFSGTGGGNIEKSAKRDKIKEKQRKEIQLPKDEYAQVIHELNTNLTKEERNKKQIRRYIGNSFYTIENNGFNEYKIIGKQNIDDIYN